MGGHVDVPNDLINELRDPHRKRSVKTILRENWNLIGDIDKALKTIGDEVIGQNELVLFLLHNFLFIITLIVNPRRISTRKPKTRSDEIQKFEDDLRDAQKNWRHFFDKHEATFKLVSTIAMREGKVNFHGELWQKSKFQKFTSRIIHVLLVFRAKTEHLIPPSRFIFMLIASIANWTLTPLLNFPSKTRIEPSNERLRVETVSKCDNNYYDIEYVEKVDEKLVEFDAQVHETSKHLSEKELEWIEEANKHRKEVSARLEVQTKRFAARIGEFEKERESRRKREEQAFQEIMQQQQAEFRKMVGEIEERRKMTQDEELEQLLEMCEHQDEALLYLFDNRKTRTFQWEQHEAYWSNRLHLLRNSLAQIRSEFWSFERYFIQRFEQDNTRNVNFIEDVYKMESASFGRTVTRTLTFLNTEQDFFESLLHKYSDDFFLRILLKIVNKVAGQLDKVILELWSVAVHIDARDDLLQLRNAVHDIDPYSIPTLWRLKGICHSADPHDYHDEGLRDRSLSNGH
ncbi:unnamed protein product [Caenorhabditis sp. 36 PRJEB53466]|nr:unnamed protein product [Caenorhabditis sp. 36 PRJEB53466]